VGGPRSARASLDRSRYTQVIAVFAHPVLSSGPHGGDTIEAATLAIREL
jgi:hypothetical protein